MRKILATRKSASIAKYFGSFDIVRLIMRELSFLDVINLTSTCKYLHRARSKNILRRVPFYPYTTYSAKNYYSVNDVVCVMKFLAHHKSINFNAKYLFYHVYTNLGKYEADNFFFRPVVLNFLKQKNFEIDLTSHKYGKVVRYGINGNLSDSSVFLYCGMSTQGKADGLGVAYVNDSHNGNYYLSGLFSGTDTLAFYGRKKVDRVIYYEPEGQSDLMEIQSHTTINKRPSAIQLWQRPSTVMVYRKPALKNGFKYCDSHAKLDIYSSGQLQIWQNVPLTLTGASLKTACTLNTTLTTHWPVFSSCESNSQLSVSATWSQIQLIASSKKSMTYGNLEVVYPNGRVELYKGVKFYRKQKTDTRSNNVSLPAVLCDGTTGDFILKKAGCPYPITFENAVLKTSGRPYTSSRVSVSQNGPQQTCWLWHGASVTESWAFNPKQHVPVVVRMSRNQVTIWRQVAVNSVGKLIGSPNFSVFNIQSQGPQVNPFEVCKSALNKTKRLTWTTRMMVKLIRANETHVYTGVLVNLLGEIQPCECSFAVQKPNGVLKKWHNVSIQSEGRLVQGTRGTYEEVSPSGQRVLWIDVSFNIDGTIKAYCTGAIKRFNPEKGWEVYLSVKMKDNGRSIKTVSGKSVFITTNGERIELPANGWVSLP